MFSALAVLLLVAAPLARAMPDCRDPPYQGGEVLGAFSRCDVADACAYCTRRQTTFDFLCCEGHNGFPAVHVLNPLVFYVFWQHAWATFVYVVAIEIVEVGWVAMHSDLPAAAEDDGFDESLAGLLLGAVLICTTMAILLGFWLVRVFGVPGPLTSTDQRTTSTGFRALLVIAWIVAQLSVLIAVFADWPGGFIGYFVTLAVLLVIYSFVFSINTKLNNDHIWGSAKRYPVWKRVLFFWTFAIIVLAIGIPTAAGSGSWLANDWYIAWIFAGGIAATLALVSMIIECACPRAPRWASRFFLDFFLLFAAIGVVLYADDAIQQPSSSSTLSTIGHIFFFGGLLGILGTVIERSVYLTKQARGGNEPLLSTGHSKAELTSASANLRQRRSAVDSKFELQ